MRVLSSLAMLVVFASANALAQTTNNAPPTPSEEPDDKAWSLTASAYTYFVPDSANYVRPTFTADRARLHLEARYNYEALHAGSAWVGYNFSGGETLEWAFTPMLGGVFGDLTGVAPGYKGSLSWWKLELNSEGEHVFDTGNSSDSFFYNWSELTLAPVDQLRFGPVTQRTRAHESDREINEERSSASTTRRGLDRVFVRSGRRQTHVRPCGRTELLCWSGEHPEGLRTIAAQVS